MALTPNTLGSKRDCPKCGAKFFDMGANPINCPKCKHSWKPVAAAKPKPAKSAEPVKPKKIVKSLLVDDEDALITDSFEDSSEAGVSDLEDLNELDSAPEVISLEEVEEHSEDAEVDPNSDDAEEGMFLEDLTSGGELFDDLDDIEEQDDEDDDDSEHRKDDDDDDAKLRRKKRK